MGFFGGPNKTYVGELSSITMFMLEDQHPCFIGRAFIDGMRVGHVSIVLATPATPVFSTPNNPDHISGANTTGIIGIVQEHGRAADQESEEEIQSVYAAEWCHSNILAVYARGLKKREYFEEENWKGIDPQKVLKIDLKTYVQTGHS